jgi:hypothetical protein
VARFCFHYKRLFLHFDQGSLRESRVELVPPTIYSITALPIMIRFSDTLIAQGSKALNQPSDGPSPIRVAPELPCMRTSCAYAAPLRSIQNIRTANLRATATLAIACPRRNFNR